LIDKEFATDIFSEALALDLPRDRAPVLNLTDACRLLSLAEREAWGKKRELAVLAIAVIIKELQRGP